MASFCPFFFLGGVDSALAHILVGGLTLFFFFYCEGGSVSSAFPLDFGRGAPAELFSKGVGSDVIRLLGGLCNLAPTLFVGTASRFRRPLSGCHHGAQNFLQGEEGGDGDVIRGRQ